MTRLTPERRAVLEHLAEVGEASPSEIARALGRGPGSTRELLRLMARDGRDGLIVSPTRGRYVLRREAPDAPPDVPAGAFAGVGLDREPLPAKLGEGELWAYSEADGGMLPNAELRRRKGYVD